MMMQNESNIWTEDKTEPQKYCTTKKDPKHKWIPTYALSTKV